MNSIRANGIPFVRMEVFSRAKGRVVGCANGAGDSCE